MAVAAAASVPVIVLVESMLPRYLRLPALVALAIVSSGTTSGRRDFAPPVAAVALVNVNVVDVVTGTTLPAQTIIIERGTITTVAPAASVTVPAGAAVHRMGGAYVIPGLWDMHVRVGRASRHALPRLLASGITGVRIASPATGAESMPARERDDRGPSPRVVSADAGGGAASTGHRAMLHQAPATHDSWQRDVREHMVGGAVLLAGSGADVTESGGALADELEALVKEAGLTPLQSLQSATLNPARAMRTNSRAGRVAAGFQADLVILERNPLEKIGNVRHVHAVVHGGRLLDRFTLDSLLHDGR